MHANKQTVHHTNPWRFALQIGFFAGLIWGGVRIAEYYFKFTEVIPGFLAEPFMKHSFIASWSGHLFGWGVFTVFSIAAAFIYAAFFRKIKGPWFGLLYGAAWWLLLYLLIGPWTGMMKAFSEQTPNTLITDSCLFLVWGLFIGYSTAFEFTDERFREPVEQAG
ncbi:hypothetical protein DUZ99_14905 [Xylanibacillus composti]|uniref:Membrane protein YqhR n=1 Tax=Xylanibacillus composti TaxID=1572762 RepID=A0A8J4M429_9BACL|nr:YqhR family membrane protein [Xylanibacillus composti]MDT9726269.1 hypothetical protein [Xylanibacillus composti]GIQ70702.1 hypothetical protein XYCOK13_35260 [Xylanibacillus composti]